MASIKQRKASADEGKKRFGVIGDPIEHSLSPALFSFLFQRLGLPYHYEALRVGPEKLAGFMQRARAKFTGLNVTIPHKERIIELLDKLDETAQALQAVNVVANRDGELWGFNTDVAGFLVPLKARGIAAQLRGKRAVVLGAGGAARAALFALKELGIYEIVLVNRTRERAERLVQWARALGARNVIYITLSNSDLARCLSEATLLVNATPIGMYPHVEACPLPQEALKALHKGLIVYDLVYNPLQTRLLQEANARGACALDGLEMLIAQALRALCIWLPEISTMLDDEALRLELREHLKGQLRA